MPRPDPPVASVSSVPVQERGHDEGDDELVDPAALPGRSWVHPSEVGLRQRTRTDRRRGAWLAATLVAAGVGLLAVGVSIGFGGSTSVSSARRPPVESAASSLASLTLVTDHGRSSATGVVVDGDGHVATGALPTGTVEVWASCGGRQPERVDVLAHDQETGITILTLPAGSGRPVVQAPSLAAGEEVLLVTAGQGESAPATRTGTLDSDGLRFVDMLDSTTTDRLLGVVSGPTPVHERDGGAAFDRRGRFVGLVTTDGLDRTAILPAATVFEVVTGLVG